MKTLDEFNREFSTQLNSNINQPNKKSEKKKQKKQKQKPAAQPAVSPMNNGSSQSPNGFPSLDMLRSNGSEMASSSQELKSTPLNTGSSAYVNDNTTAPSVYSFNQSKSSDNYFNTMSAVTVHDKNSAKKKSSPVGKIIFSIFLIIIVLFTLLMTFGLRLGIKLPVTFFFINGTSMQDVYPENAMLIVKQKEIDSIVIGDDLTYIVNGKYYITHRVTQVVKNEDGTRSFQTKGVNNDAVDEYLVNEDDVVGVVAYNTDVFCSFFSFFSQHRAIFCIGGCVAVVLVGFIIVITRIKKKSK